MLRLLPEACYEVTVQGEAMGQRIDNVLHFRLNLDAPTSDPLTTDTVFLRAFRQRWRTAILPNLSLSYKVNAYVVRAFLQWVPGPGPIDPKTILYYDSSIIVGDPVLDAGQILADSMPPHVAATVRKITGLVSRNWRGGMRLGPLGEVQCANAEIQPAPFTAFQAGVSLLGDPVFPIAPDPVDTNPMVLVVFSRSLFLATVEPPVAARPFTRPVTQLLLSQFLSSQVSRKPRPGGA